MKDKKHKYLLVVTGPTAVGKTALCIELAKYFQTEIVSADSRQFFKEMSIGTAKPTEDELAQVRHHFVGNLSIEQYYSAGNFEKDALALLEALFKEKDIVLLTGGSGMYINAVCEGFDELPDVPVEIRNQLNDELEEKGLTFLTQKLEQLDPDYYRQVDLSNPQRVIRALEVCQATGKPYSSFRRSSVQERPFYIIKVGLERGRQQLYDRINERVDVMIDQGLFGEVKGLYPYRNHNALQTVGYKEIFDYMDGAYEKEEAIRLLKRNTRRYAKRQLTWFKRDNQFKWFHPSQKEEIIQYVESKVNERG
jgi:tRNA dimethylallyltransferase